MHKGNTIFMKVCVPGTLQFLSQSKNYKGRRGKKERNSLKRVDVVITILVQNRSSRQKVGKDIKGLYNIPIR